MCACQVRARTCPTRPPLPENRGDLLILLEPYSPSLVRLDFRASGLAARRVDGREVPLALGVSELRGPRMSHARRWARGAVPAGSYAGLVVRVEHATLHRGDGPAELLVPSESTFIPAPFTIAVGEARILALELDYDRSLGDGYAFRPGFTVRAIEADLPQLAGYVSDAASHSVSVVDPRTHQLVRVIPTGHTPRGLVVDRARWRTYVALAGGDAVDVIDIASGSRLERLQLHPGDEPHAIALSADGEHLLTANAGSNTVAFLDSASGAELARVPTGEAPTEIIMAPAGQRAYVVNRLSDSITVLDVANQTAVGEIPTASMPVRAAFDGRGERLFVIHQGAPELIVSSVPEHVEIARIQVGLDATAIQVDPATDLLYVATAGPPRILVYDTHSLLPIDSFRLPAPASRLIISHAERALLALVPERQVLMVLDLTSHKPLGVVEVGCSPFEIALTEATR